LGRSACLFAGLVLVAIIVSFEFGDWRAPLLTVILALAVLTSVLGSLLLTGMTLNISSFVGAIMMVGIVGEKAVFLIQDAREELRRGLPVREAWVEASRKRLRAVMMTVFASHRTGPSAIRYPRREMAAMRWALGSSVRRSSILRESAA